MKIAGVASALLVVWACPAHAGPDGDTNTVATASKPAPGDAKGDDDDADNAHDRALKAAPPAHRASGVVVEHPPADANYRWLNRALSVPRAVVRFAFAGPKLLIEQLDDYRDSQSPNSLHRGDQGSRWRTGALLRVEHHFGWTIGALVGYAIAPAVALDAYALGFGRAGRTAGLKLHAGPYLDDRVAMALRGEYAHGRNHVFAGVGDRDLGGADGIDPYAQTPTHEADYEDSAATIDVTGAVKLTGAIQLEPLVRLERHATEDDGDAGIATRFDTSGLPGFDEAVDVAYGQVAVVYDTRDPAFSWISHAAPSSGWRLRAAGGGGRADAERTGQTSFARYWLGAERLFDLFRGNRVLSISAEVDGMTGDREQLPFMLLPSLGGPRRLRAYPRGRFRDRIATHAELRYEWGVGYRTQASLFVEAGDVHSSVGDLTEVDPRWSFGGELRLVDDRSTQVRLVLAGSPQGDLGFYVIAGGM